MKSIVYFLYTVANILCFFCHISYAQNNHVMDVQLEAIPKEVRIYEEDTATFKLFLSKPATRSLKIVEHPDWLDVSLDKPFISNDTVVLKVFKNEQFKRPIGLTSFLKLETEDSQLELYLMLIPKKYGQLKLSTDSIHFKSYESIKRIDFVRTLDESYRIKACSKEKWIEFGKKQNDTQKVISSNMFAFDGKFIDNSSIKINLNKNGLKEGLHFGKISFYYGSNFKDTLTLNVSAEVHQLELLPKRLDTLFFSNQNKQKEFYIRNNGCYKFDFCIKAGNKAIICKPQKATIAPHDSIKISVAINGNFLYEGDNVFNISIEDLKHNKILNLPVKVFYLNGEESEIGKNVVEAGYSKTNDLLLIIAKNPNEIRFYDTKIKKKQAIQLAHEPKNLSTSPDGNYALVSSYKTLYYIDIKKQEIIQEFHIPVDCFDIALSDNKWLILLLVSSNFV